MFLKIVDHCSDPGSPGKANDDALALGTTLAAVFDGATGLADRPIFADAPSDAAWLARFAAARFADAPADAPIGEIVARCCMQARAATGRAVLLDTLPPYAWPAASFESIRLVAGEAGPEVEISGLGDSVMYLQDRTETVSRHSAMPGNREAEIRAARSARLQAGQGPEGGPLIREGPVLEGLRAARARQNRPGGIWTLGLVAEAAEHLRTERVTARPDMRFLLATDGFTALCESYGRYDPAALLEAAFQHGLGRLIDELRHVERVEDPDSVRFARFKQSDDATAILGEITIREPAM